MVKIYREHVEQITKQAKDHLPIECCGILAGKSEGDMIEIREIYPMTNVDQSAEHFSLDPQEQFKVYYALREKGLQLLGNYHSHPATPARPSQEDIRLAYDPNAIYLILSLKDAIPALKCFSIADGEYKEIQLTIAER